MRIIKYEDYKTSVCQKIFSYILLLKELFRYLGNAEILKKKIKKTLLSCLSLQLDRFFNVHFTPTPSL